MIYHWNNVKSLKDYSSGHVIAIAETKEKAIAVACQKYKSYLLSVPIYTVDEIERKMFTFETELKLVKAAEIIGSETAAFIIFGSA